MKNTFVFKDSFLAAFECGQEQASRSLNEYLIIYKNEFYCCFSTREFSNMVSFMVNKEVPVYNFTLFQKNDNKWNVIDSSRDSFKFKFNYLFVFRDKLQECSMKKGNSIHLFVKDIIDNKILEIDYRILQKTNKSPIDFYEKKGCFQTLSWIPIAGGYTGEEIDDIIFGQEVLE